MTDNLRKEILQYIDINDLLSRFEKKDLCEMFGVQYYAFTMMQYAQSEKAMEDEMKIAPEGAWTDSIERMIILGIKNG